MISVEEPELLSCEELSGIEKECEEALNQIKKAEFNSVKGMVIPPIFSFKTHRIVEETRYLPPISNKITKRLEEV